MGALYLRIPKSFAEGMDGKESNVVRGDHFGYVITVDGRYVCAPASATNFEGDFIALKASGGFVSLVVLELSDFPLVELPAGGI